MNRLTVQRLARAGAVPFLMFTLAGAFAIPLPNPAMAQGPPGVEDQRNTPATGGMTSGCGSSGASIYQSFTPRGADITAVDLQMRAGGSFPTDEWLLEIQIREDDPTGAVVGAAATVVVGPLAPGAAVTPQFVFTPPAAPLHPGDLYVIELISPAPEGVPSATIASWFVSEGDPYPGGTAFGCTGKSIADRDFNFVTYTSSLDPPTIDPPRVAPPEPAEPVCWQILDRVPRAAIDAALADPDSVYGYDKLENPGKPEGPYNRRRTWLTMRTLAVPYHANYNGLVYRAGCP